MNSKILPAVPCAAAVTALILFAMHTLIAMQPMALNDRARHTLGEIIMPPRDEALIIDQWQPEPIRRPEPTPARHLDNEHDPQGNTIAVPRHPVIPRPGTTLLHNPLAQDGPLVAIVRVQPTYPIGPAQKGLEGWVTVQFDVLPDGSVTNVEVLESSSRVFERAAVQAASRFRYKAQVLNGEPQLTTGIRYRFRFEMD